MARLDLETGAVSVDRSTTQIGKERVTTAPKNHEQRRVQIDAQTVTAQRTWRKAQAAERLAMGTAYVDSDGALFTWQDGTPLQPNYVTKEFVKVQADMGLPRLVLHGLRHTHITILLREGVPVHVVAKRAGHKGPSATLKSYADVIP